MQLITLPNGWEVRESPKMQMPYIGNIPPQTREGQENLRSAWAQYNAHIASLQTYPGIGPKPDYPDGELPEGVVRLQWQHWCQGKWYDADSVWHVEALTSNPDWKRIVAISTPPTEQEENVVHGGPNCTHEALVEPLAGTFYCPICERSWGHNPCKEKQEESQDILWGKIYDSVIRPSSVFAKHRTEWIATKKSQYTLTPKYQ